MKKNELKGGYLVDFEVIGLVCNQKEYKLAWHLNEALGIEFIKQEDIRIEFSDKSVMVVSNYKYEGEFVVFELLRNKLVAGGNQSKKLLIPELKQFDYFIKFSDQTKELTIENVSVSIKEIPIIEYALQVNFISLKSRENLFY